MPSIPPRLPNPLAGFVGRARELGQLAALLPTTRLLTLTGAGGSGKTRLALELAARTHQGYPDGIGWVELAPLGEPEVLAEHVAHALEIREDGSRSAEEGLLAALQDRSMLLVLDNCEHVVEATASLATRLLAHCPRLTILTTSRQPLGVPGEHHWAVPPLSLPPATGELTVKEIAAADAVQLFVERALEVSPLFTLSRTNATVVADICRRLDGLPLALELAAARLKVLSPEEIRQRLGDALRLLANGPRTVDPRHRTLRATVDWSYRQLSPAEQLLLQRLSVFAGGCTLEAVEAVCAGDGIPRDEVLDVLTGLVDRSLVVMREQEDAARYTLLEVVRQFAQQQLAEAGAAQEIGHRHFAWFLAQARAARIPVESTSSPEWIARLVADGDNLRAALEWHLGPGGEPAAALELAGLLWLVWFHGAQWSEGRHWLEAALAHPAAQEPTLPRARALLGAAVLAYFFRKPEVTRTRLEEADRILATLDAPRERPLVWYRYAHLLADLGELDRAQEVAQRALDLARTLDERWILGEVLVYASGFVHRVRGELDAAEACFAEAELLGRETGACIETVEAGISRAMLALQRGDTAAAGASVRRTSRRALELRAPWYSMRVLLAAAGWAAARGDDLGAVRLLSVALTLSATAKAPVFPHEEPFVSRLEAGLRERLGPDEFAIRSAAAADLTPAAALEELAEAPVEPRQPTRRHLDVRVLGPLEVRMDGVPVADEVWRYSKARELLAFLLLHPEGRTRDQIGAALWPEASDAQVKNRFHVTVHHLRRALGGADVVRRDRGRYQIGGDLHITFDAGEFAREVRAALKAGVRSAADCAALSAVLDRYRGDLLEGEPMDDWHMELSDDLARWNWLGLDALCAAHLAAGRPEEAIVAAERLVKTDRLAESGWRRLIEALALAGRRDEALRRYAELVALLDRELKEEPEPVTRELMARVRAGHRHNGAAH